MAKILNDAMGNIKWQTTKMLMELVKYTNEQRQQVNHTSFSKIRGCGLWGNNKSFDGCGEAPKFGDFASLSFKNFFILNYQKDNDLSLKYHFYAKDDLI
jgi:hypothetical protein